jgi:predicted nuclease of predicted toxin-antitoxin system
MAVRFYMDAQFSAPITKQLRRRGVDALAAPEEKTNELPDDELLDLASSLSRVIVTFDIRFRVMAENWIRTGRAFAGLVFVNSNRASIGQVVSDLEMIAKVYEPDELRNKVKFVPLK